MTKRNQDSVEKTVRDIRRSTFYGWLKRFDEGGIDGLADRKPSPRSVWNKLPEPEQQAVVELAWIPLG